MYRCRWFVLCELVVVSAENNLSLTNCLTELTAASFPTVHPRFAFATALALEGERPDELHLRVVREDFGEVVGHVAGPAMHDGVHWFFNFPLGIRLHREGQITYSLQAKTEHTEGWETIASDSIQVRLRHDSASDEQ